METSKKIKTFDISIASIFAQFMAVSGLCTLQMALGAGEMFRFVNMYPKSEKWISLEGLFCTCTILGCVQSTLLLGRFGHQKCVALACVEFLVAGLGVAGLGSYVGKAYEDKYYVMGACAMAFSEGASVGPCLAYIGEVCEPWLRSSVCVAVIALKYASFMVSVMVFGYDSKPSTFPIVAVSGFPIATIAIMVFKTPDSPIWLLIKGEYAKAHRSLGKLRGNDTDITICDQEFQEMVDYTLAASGRHTLNEFYATGVDDNDGSSAWKQLLRPEVLRPFWWMISHLVIMNFLFILYISNFLTDIYEHLCIDNTNQRDYVWWLYLPLCGYVVTVFLVKILGKRLLSVFALSLTSIIYVAYSLLNLYESKNNNESWNEKRTNNNWMNWTINFVTLLIPSIGILPIPEMLITEIFPVKSRYITCNICSALIFTTNFTLKMFHPNMMNAINNYILYPLSDNVECTLLPLMLGILGLIDCYYTYFYQKETENKSLREIYEILK